MKRLSGIRVYQTIGRITFARSYCSKKETTTQPKEGHSRSSSVPGSANVGSIPGVSSNVMLIPDGEVGPGASKSSTYKNPEYYCYNPFSYAQAEAEMFKFRLPQPSSRA